ncbi:26S protease regulatory subunit [Madurella fahalii]|uniref:26S protease regulatory subunit n=1 Tax=Madurella fahalii TaxID=1157608 RepID=A0ABQ0G7E3_9PEZI
MPFSNLVPRNVSEKLWKWRYKLRHLGDSGEKTLSDFSSAQSAVSDGKKKTENKGGSKSSSTPAAASTGADNTSKNCELGANASVKTLYEGPNSREGRFDWVDYPPKQLSKSAAKAQSRVAIKVFKVKDTEKPVISGRFSLRYHMIEIQNPLLVAAAAEILKKQDMHLDVGDNAVFQYPFQELYFGYDDFVARLSALDETEPGHPLKPFLRLFVALLDDIFAGTRAKLKALRADGLVSFKLAWAFFPKNTTVISWGNNCELLSKVTKTTYQCMAGGRKALAIEGKVLRFDGASFLWEDHSINIPSFLGNLPVTDLAAYPLEFHDAADDVQLRLTSRGRKVLDYQGLTYVNYNGIAIHSDGADVQKHNVEGRVLVDVIGYKKHHLAQGSREGSDPQTKKQLLVSDGGSGPRTKRELVVNDDDSAETAADGKTATGLSAAAAGLKRLSPAAQERNKRDMLAREAKEPHLMFMLPVIEGYALKNKLWVSFFVEDIKPMVWNDQAYDHLVYDEQQKDLIMSFVESHGSGEGGTSTTAVQRRHKAMEDVIAGKGQGLVMLLSGPPGTGKTLMAEAVADRTQRPLFYLQAEDLGINAAVLGANIKKVFQMATEWDAVILLDEADVFMAERHPQDIARNELVSIFLRELEYFRGIIFLTTNLYSTIDSAFRSRVSLHLIFNSLTPEARTLIWRKFLDRLPPREPASPAAIEGLEGPDKEQRGGFSGDGAEAELDDDLLTDQDIKELAAWQLNGREIKTAVKMTRTWCDHKGYPLTLSRLENGIKVTSPHATKCSHEKDTSLYDE